MCVCSCIGDQPWWSIQNPTIEESERLRGEGDQIELIDLRFERGPMVGFRKERRQDFPCIACSWDE